jgi:hypothetical protein
MNTLTIGSGSDHPKSVTINTLGVVSRLLVSQFADVQVTASLSPIADLKGSTPGQKIMLEMDVPQTVILNGKRSRKVANLIKVYVFIFIPTEG